jgi:hypothetical protein
MEQNWTTPKPIFDRIRNKLEIKIKQILTIFGTIIDIIGTYTDHVRDVNGTKVANICSKRAHFSVRI